jgi:predicted O-linked N-acetylglucosamine transferase (SPINDLY family)
VGTGPISYHCRDGCGEHLRQDKPGPASCAKIEGGQLSIDSAGKPVPDFLLSANQAIGSGCRSKAGDLLCADNLRRLRIMLKEDPSRIDLIYMLVKLLLALDRAVQAEPWCQHIIEQASTDVAWFYMALVYRGIPNSTQKALKWARQAFEAKPDCEPYADVYARCLAECGQVKGTTDLLDYLDTHGLADVPAIQRILATLLYCAQTTRSDLMRGYRLLGQALSRGIAPRTRHGNDPDPCRRIRIGFISPDFRRNAAAIPFEVFMDGVNHENLEIYAYGNVASPDFVTERIQAKVDHYVDIAATSSGKVADLIERHRVDILVAWGGYVQGHCLDVMAYKPAPVQVDFGWVTTTGLPAIDYRLTDSLLDPPETQLYHREELVYIPGGSSVFSPPQATSLVGPLPAHQNGYVTFGSFNRRIKISGKMLEIWAEILQQTPGSRFIMKFLDGDSRRLQAEFQGRFQDLGISPDRIDVYGSSSYHDYLDIIGLVDIALDTYPFNGNITTLECLWMGIPSVALTGEVLASRMGLSILKQVDLELFSATTSAEYIAKACSFSGQLESLAQIRQSLRGRMLNSPLCDPLRLAREMEAGFRQMWQHWCENTRFSSSPVQDAIGLSP